MLLGQAGGGFATQAEFAVGPCPSGIAGDPWLERTVCHNSAITVQWVPAKTKVPIRFLPMGTVVPPQAQRTLGLAAACEVF
jgi:hypothetical protein